VRSIDFPEGYTTVTAIAEVPAGVCAGRDTIHGHYGAHGFTRRIRRIHRRGNREVGQGANRRQGGLTCGGGFGSIGLKKSAADAAYATIESREEACRTSCPSRHRRTRPATTAGASKTEHNLPLATSTVEQVLLTRTGRRVSICFDVHSPDNLCPLLGFIGDELSELRRRHRRRQNA
jgi:hypothetical protein